MTTPETGQKRPEGDRRRVQPTKQDIYSEIRELRQLIRDFEIHVRTGHLDDAAAVAEQIRSVRLDDLVTRRQTEIEERIELEEQERRDKIAKLKAEIARLEG